MRQDKVLAFRLAGACALALVLAAGAASAQTAGPETLGFRKHFTVEIANPSKLTLENQAVVLDVAEIRSAVAPDFNTYMYVLFEIKGADYNLVVSQADDLDKDRYHDEIVFVRTLPAASTTRLVCYYTPNKSIPQLMTTQKAFARGAWETGAAEAGWESNLAAYRFVNGRIGFYGKLQPGLVLRTFPAGLAKIRDWGIDVLGPGDSAGAGGLSVWDGAKRLPLFGPSAPQVKLTVISPGPVRGLIKAEYPAVKTAAGDVTLTVFFSAFADNIYSRQDVIIGAKTGLPVVLGPGFEKLSGETAALDRSKGALSIFGKGAGAAGETGLAAIFAPSVFAGLDDAGTDRAVRLAGQGGRRLTYWVAGAWGRGATATEASSGQQWVSRVADLAARLLAPVRIEFKAQ